MVLNIRNFCKQKLQSNYSRDIQFYSNNLPLLSRKEVIAAACERIEVLKEVALVTGKNRRKSDEQVRLLVTERLKAIKSHGYETLLNSKGHQANSDQDLLNRVSDHVSFTVILLSLICSQFNCKNFRRLEKKFFKLRVSALDYEGLHNILNTCNEFIQITDSEKQELKPKLIRYLEYPDAFDKIEFFKVPISYLIRQINPSIVYFNRGTAFVPIYMMREVLCAKFRHHIKRKISLIDIEFLEWYKDFFGPVENVRYLIRRNFLKMQELVMREIGVTAEDVEKLSAKTFPPCMRYIHEKFKENHHLKHESRLQFTLFLKGIGVPANEALKLFEKEFTKTMDVELFNKEYKYYVEHAYGLRGSRVDYDPKNCIVIQETSRVPGDCNGCPFQVAHVTDIEDLDKTLSKWKISNSDKSDIIENSHVGNFGSACANYFKAINGCKMSKFIDHPNHFFNDSCFVQHIDLFENLHEEELNDTTFYDESLLIPEKTITSSDSLLINKSVNSEILAEDTTKASVVSDTKKRKADMALGGEELPDKKKKFKTNSTNANVALSNKELPTLEQIISKNDCDTLENPQNASTSDATSSVSPEPLPVLPEPLPVLPEPSSELMDLVKTEVELLKNLVTDFDNIIPIEKIKTGSIIYTPRI